MPYDCGTKSFGVTTVYDSGDFPALFDELLRRLRYADARAEQAVINGNASGPRRGIGLAIYVEKTGLGPFETTHVAVRPDGRIVVDTGGSSMGPGLETVLAQILGDALGIPAARFDVRHADTAAIDSTRVMPKSSSAPTRSARARSYRSGSWVSDGRPMKRTWSAPRDACSREALRS